MRSPCLGKYRAMPSYHEVVSPLLQRFRARRMRELVDLLGLTRETTVLDVGGDPEIWGLSPVRPAITFLNVYSSSPVPLPAGDSYVQGDARALPFGDRAFDLVYSNSVIEHLGNWPDQRAMASEVRRVGRGYYVQTPNRSFPLEPHFFGLGIQWMPRAVQRRVVPWGTLWGWVTRPTPRQVESQLDEIRLLGRHEVELLFPDAQVRRERFAGLDKSFIAVRRTGAGGVR